MRCNCVSQLGHRWSSPPFCRCWCGAVAMCLCVIGNTHTHLWQHVRAKHQRQRRFVHTAHARRAPYTSYLCVLPVMPHTFDWRAGVHMLSVCCRTNHTHTIVVRRPFMRAISQQTLRRRRIRLFVVCVCDVCVRFSVVRGVWMKRVNVSIFILRDFPRIIRIVDADHDQSDQFQGHLLMFSIRRHRFSHTDYCDSIITTNRATENGITDAAGR